MAPLDMISDEINCEGEEVSRPIYEKEKTTLDLTVRKRKRSFVKKAVVSSCGMGHDGLPIDQDSSSISVSFELEEVISGGHVSSTVNSTVQLKMGSHSIDLDAHSSLAISQNVFQADIVETQDTSLYPIFHALALQKKLKHQHDPSYHTTTLISALFEKVIGQGVCMSEWSSFIDDQLQKPIKRDSNECVLADSESGALLDIPVVRGDNESFSRFGCCAPNLLN